MWRNVGLDLLIAALVVGLWYLIAVQLNRRRSMTILYWIDDAIQGMARISGLEWLSASQFLVRLRFSENHFKGAVLKIKLQPWELPLRWIANRIESKPETLTFEADLATPPSFSMQVFEQRWAKVRQTTIEELQRYSFERLGPFVLTTKAEWQQNVINMMETVSCSDHCEFISVSFNPETPNFAATMPLDCMKPGSQYRATIFETMRELAQGASTSMT